MSKMALGMISLKEPFSPLFAFIRAKRELKGNENVENRGEGGLKYKRGNCPELGEAEAEAKARTDEGSVCCSVLECLGK